MKYLGKYQHIKHLLEDGQYYLIYYQDNLNLSLSLGTKIRIILLVKYIGMGCGADRVSIFIIYENTYMNLDHKIYFLKSESKVTLLSILKGI